MAKGNGSWSPSKGHVSVSVSLVLTFLTVDHHDCQEVDIFVWGPPCAPYSRLSVLRQDPHYNPLREESAQPFIKGARWIRDFTMIFRLEEQTSFQGFIDM